MATSSSTRPGLYAASSRSAGIRNPQHSRPGRTSGASNYVHFAPKATDDRLRTACRDGPSRVTSHRRKHSEPFLRRTTVKSVTDPPIGA
jgi:hypothetical protein